MGLIVPALIVISINKKKSQSGRKPQKQIPKKKPKVSIPRQVRQAPDIIPMSECAAKYAIAIVDPWNPEVEGVCVPSNPARPTFKVTSYLRGTMAIGTGGVGFVAVSPCLANDRVAAYFTNGLYTGTSINCSATLGAVGTYGATMTNLPYGAASLTTSNPYEVYPISGRIVSCGLSIRYTGTELNRGGLTFCYSDPDHESVNTLTPDNLGAKLETSIEGNTPDRSSCWVSASAIRADELTFPDVSQNTAQVDVNLLTVYPFSSANSVTSAAGDLAYGAPIMAAAVTGTSGNTYEFEYVQHSEFIGAAAQPFLTQNSSDATGLALVQTAAGRLPSAKRANPNVSLKKLMKRELVKAAKEIGPSAFKAGTAMLMAAL